MENQKILELINKNEIEKLKNLVIEELRLEGVKTSTGKTAFKKVANYLKKQTQEKRPVLSHCNIINDMQVFTDSYFISLVKAADFNPLITHYTTVFNESAYPKMDHIVEGIEKKLDTIQVMSYSDLLLMIKEKSVDENKYTHLEFCNKYFDIKKLEIALLSLNISNKKDTVAIHYNLDKNSAIKIEKDNGSFTIILPIRKYDI